MDGYVHKWMDEWIARRTEGHMDGWIGWLHVLRRIIEMHKEYYSIILKPELFQTLNRSYLVGTTKLLLPQGAVQ